LRLLGRIDEVRLAGKGNLFQVIEPKRMCSGLRHDFETVRDNAQKKAPPLAQIMAQLVGLETADGFSR